MIYKHRGFFAQDSFTMAGLPEKGIQWHADVVSEQVNDMDKMTSLDEGTGYWFYDG